MPNQNSPDGCFSRWIGATASGSTVPGFGHPVYDGIDPRAACLLDRIRTVARPGDLALRRAVARLWELDEPPSLAEVDAVGDRFRPWRTLAAVYLLTDQPWESAEPVDAVVAEADVRQ